MRSFSATAASLAALLLLAGCSLTDRYFGEQEEPPLPGEREAILELGRGPVADPDIANLPIVLPPMQPSDWPIAGRDPAHSGGHLAWSANPTLAWQVQAGAGAQDEARRVLSPPIISNGQIFVLDAVLNVRAHNASTGQEAWAINSAPEGEEDGFGGGLASDGSVVYVAGGHAQALALNASDGSLLWRVRLPGPARAAPTLSNALVIATTANNAVIALDPDDGRRRWALAGAAESAALLGGATPAIDSGAVIAGLSTGDLVALRVENGRELWRASLGSIRRFDFGTKLSDFSGPPTIADNIVYATSAAGRTAALSMRAGSRIWEVRLGGGSQVWVAGDFAFMVTDNAELLSLFRPDGRVRWVQPLQRFEDPEDMRDPLMYAGPVLAGGKLALVRSDGVLVLHDPATGQSTGELPIGSSTLLPPVVAGSTLYTLSEDGTLSAFR